MSVSINRSIALAACLALLPVAALAQSRPAGGAGVPPTTCTTHQWVNAIGAAGGAACAQPASTDVSGLGTAATVNTGTSGATIPLLNGGNTWSAAQTFSGTLRFTTVFASPTAPTVSGTGLGTSPSIVTNGTFSGAITAGSSPANATFTITLPTDTHGWGCVVQDITSNATITMGETAYTTTTAVMQAYSRTTGLASALNASDVLGYQCSGW